MSAPNNMDDCSNTNNYPVGTFKICPRFIEFNNRARRDLSIRYSIHNKNRSKCITECANRCLNELRKLANNTSVIPQFPEQIDILKKSILEMNHEINRTYTVMAHKCKTPIKTYQAFAKKGINIFCI